ncbi:hypothetical protein BTM25_22130 [Actinomadura rubteroloni]|uniref:Histidine kinase/HSP90-like ATPase domain-containing protein n=1 Tax=Actinomadura rubteroloni TaxID=1926885 RepID=A0A2P4URX1_9ACTN|nr:ATP-binding protein [Actinomadura rubteroloni]POM27792.1 hypothetical protein BTM25_22130 [Actinomadura rubteroloni]
MGFGDCTHGRRQPLLGGDVQSAKPPTDIPVTNRPPATTRLAHTEEPARQTLSSEVPAAAVPTVTRQYPASLAAAGVARDQTRNALQRWGLAALASDAVLIVGELMANAVEVSGVLDRIGVHVRAERTRIVLAVWDGDAALPAPRHVELSLEALDLDEDNWDDNGGWGLTIVQSLSSACWIEQTPPRGKWVCAALTHGRM